MTCSQCHTWNFRDYKYCRQCGTKLEAQAAAGPAGQEDPEVEQLLQQTFALLDQGNTEEALATVQAALALQPGSPTAHSVLGGIYERQGDVPAAVQQYELALQLNPESAADREKLALLEARAGKPREVWLTPTQIAIGTAVAAGVTIFGVGLGLMLTNRSGGTQTAAATSPLSSEPASNAPLSASSRLNTPAGAAGRGAGTSAGTPAVTPGVAPAPTAAPAPPAPAPVTTPTTPTAARTARPSAPAAQSSIPQTGGTAPGAVTARAGTGLPAAAIGEVVPIVPPATPGGPIYQFRPGQGPGTVTPPAATRVAGPGINPAPVEPLEPETGFIRIEPAAGETVVRPAGPGPVRIGPAPRPAAPARPAAPPAISVRFGPGGASSTPAASAPAEARSGAGLAEARRVERRGFEALRRKDRADAARQYQQAARLYEGLVSRGGSEARQAQEGLESCRRALEALR